MTTYRPPLADSLIEAAIARRAPGRADPAFLAAVLEAVAVTPQVRRPWLPDRIRERRFGWAALAAAALVTALIGGAIGGGLLQPSPTPTPTSPDSSVDLATSPPDSPQPSEVACATETTTVVTGATMPHTDTKPAEMPEGVLDVAAYVTRNAEGQVADVWSVRSGSATRIASIEGPDFTQAFIDDISPDGRQALLEIGEIHGGIPRPWCHDLYLVQTDGSGAERLTFSRAEEHASGGRFSSDGRYVAYESLEGSGQRITLAIIDLPGDRTPQSTRCVGGSQSIAFAWAPDGDRLAAQCSQSVEILVAGTAVGRLKVPSAFDAAATIGLSWPDRQSLLLAAADGGTSFNGPIRFWTVPATDVENNASPSRWSGPVTVTPQLNQAVMSGPTWIAPSAHGFAVYASVPGADRDAWHVVDRDTGAATLVSDGSGWELAWSSDGRSVLVVEHHGDLDQASLVLIDVASGDRRTVGSIPPEYWTGIWRSR